MYIKNMMKLSVVFVLSLMLIIMLAACGNKTSQQASSSPSGQPGQSDQSDHSNRAPVQLTISAAASLTDALQEIQKKYEAEMPGVKLICNFAASGTLQR